MTHSCFMPPGVGCPSCTCPDCGVVGLPYVCGSPEDPSGGQDCAVRAGTCRCVADDCRAPATTTGYCTACTAAGCVARRN